jgi:ABC-type nitrate/sulfonate/bicarbonate transport system substrate-binding protein
MHSNRLLLIAAWILCQWFAFACLGHAASQSESLTIGYSSFSGHYVPLWIAIEDHLGKQYGLDLKAVYAGRARPQQLLISGEMLFVVATGTGALTSHVLGVKDQVIVLTFANMVPGVIVAKPEIKSGEDLKGKVIGTGRPGALADTMVRYVLQSKLNLMPDRDVKLLPLGEPAIALQALERGVVDAASFSGPPVLMAKKKGFRELINYEKLGMVYPYNTVTTLRQTVSKKPELLERVLKTMIFLQTNGRLCHPFPASPCGRNNQTQHGPFAPSAKGSLSSRLTKRKASRFGANTCGARATTS